MGCSTSAVSVSNKSESVSKEFAGDESFKKLTLKEKKKCIGLNNLLVSNPFEDAYSMVNNDTYNSKQKAYEKYGIARNRKNRAIVFVGEYW